MSEKLICCLMDLRTLQPSELSAILSCLPESRQKKARSFRQERDKIRSIGAGLLARYALALEGIRDTLLLYDENGKPFIETHPETGLSLSHSGDYAACVIGKRDVAVDIQEHEGVREQVLRRCYTPEEQAFCDAAASREKAFYQIWCRKECQMKLREYQHLREINTLTPEPGFRYEEIPVDGENTCVVYGEGAFFPVEQRWIRYSLGEGFSPLFRGF